MAKWFVQTVPYIDPANRAVQDFLRSDNPNGSGINTAGTSYEGLGDLIALMQQGKVKVNTIDGLNLLKALNVTVQPEWLASGLSGGGSISAGAGAGTLSSVKFPIVGDLSQYTSNPTVMAGAGAALGYLLLGGRKPLVPTLAGGALGWFLAGKV